MWKEKRKEKDLEGKRNRRRKSEKKGREKR